MQAPVEPKPQSGTQVLVNILIFMGGTILLLLLVKYLIG